MSPQSYLFIRLRGIGEVVMLLPLVDLVLSQQPDARIDFVVKSPSQQLLEHDPRIGALHVVQPAAWRRSGPLGGPLGGALFLQRLRRQEYDLVVDFHGSQDTQGLARACRCRRRVGRASGRWTDRLMDAVYPFETEGRHNTEILCDILNREGIEGRPGAPRLHLSEPARAWAKNWRQEAGVGAEVLVVLNPGAAMQERQWPAERFAAVGRHLVQTHQARVVVHGGPDERDLVGGVVAAIGPGALSLVGPRLDEAAALFQTTGAVVSNDTGPMHLAVAVGAPVVGLFGPTDPGQSGPFGVEHYSIYLDCPCSPCVTEMQVCRDRKCLNDLSVDRVIERVEQALASRSD